MDLQLLYEIETIVDELSLVRMSKRQQRRVATIRHRFGVVSGYLINGLSGNDDNQRCHHALVKIRTLSEIGFADAKARQVRDRFADLLQRVGFLESWINHEMQNPGTVARLKGLAKVILSWVYGW